MSDSTLKPFHDSIVDAIQRTQSGLELSRFGLLIKETKIPKGHDDIIDAWNEKAAHFGINDMDVAESVRAQKLKETAEA